MSDELIAIVPAAGTGSRARGPGAEADLPKQYGLLAGVPMLRLAVQALLAEPRITQVRVAVSPDDERAPAALEGLPRTVWRPCGGATRAHTVHGALADAALPPDAWVLVHDAARPGLPLAALARLIEACRAAARGGLLALPVADTVKRARAGAAGPARVEATIPRDGLWQAQTPQMFRAGELQAALAAALASGAAVTDEADAMERAGHAPLLVPGAWCNFKVTWPDDVALMSRWLRGSVVAGDSNRMGFE